MIDNRKTKYTNTDHWARFSNDRIIVNRNSVDVYKQSWIWAGGFDIDDRILHRCLKMRSGVTVISELRCACWRGRQKNCPNLNMIKFLPTRRDPSGDVNVIVHVFRLVDANTSVVIIKDSPSHCHLNGWVRFMQHLHSCFCFIHNHFEVHSFQDTTWVTKGQVVLNTLPSPSVVSSIQCVTVQVFLVSRTVNCDHFYFNLAEVVCQEITLKRRVGS